MSTHAELAARVERQIQRWADARFPLLSEAEFNAWALELFAFQFQAIPVYRRFCEARPALPGKIDDWRDIPAISTLAFREFELSSFPPGARIAEFHSSTTTGQQPSRNLHSAASREVYQTSARLWFKPHLLPDCDRLAILSLTPPPDEAPQSSLVHMLGQAISTFGTPASSFAGRIIPGQGWCVRASAAVTTLQTLAAAGDPVLIAGTAFNFVQLHDLLEAQATRVSLPPGSRAMETGGYKGRTREVPKEVLYDRIGAGLNLEPGSIVSEYGMCELASQAYDRVAAEDNPRAFRFPPWARYRVVSPETGQPCGAGEWGLLRVFDLANVGTVLAIETGDLASSSERGFQLAGRAAAAVNRGCSLLAS